MEDKVAISDECAKIGLVIAKFIGGINDDEKFKKDSRRKISVSRKKNKELKRMPDKSRNFIPEK